MNVCVVGLWHLGTVTAACLASAGHHVVGLDFSADTVRQLQAGTPPLFEPGLETLVKTGLANGTLRFSDDPSAVESAEIVWIAYDTPVNDEDRADVPYVIGCVTRLFPHLKTDTLVLISSQLPVGSTRQLEKDYAASYPEKRVTFGYSPENLRLGKAISAFTQPDRIVIGLRDRADQERVKQLLQPFTERIEWMSVESAEMTKHALNAFLATSVTFANEIAALCESVGADAKEVERGLKSEARIGPKAYLGPGAAFAGGTLARDIQFLSHLGAEQHVPIHLLNAVQSSNAAHKQWAQRKLLTLLGDLDQKVVALWGLTYKPGTDTLRRSGAVELGLWLAEKGAKVRAHDPMIAALPPELRRLMAIADSALATLEGADALVIATEWPDYQAISAEAVYTAMKKPIVVDASRFLSRTLGSDPHIAYYAVGKATGSPSQ